MLFSNPKKKFGITTSIQSKNWKAGRSGRRRCLELVSMFSGRKVKVPDFLCDHCPELKQIALIEGANRNGNV